MDSREYLEQIAKIDLRIRQIEQKCERQMAEANNISPTIGGERVKSSGNSQRMADAVCSYVDTERDELTPLRQERDRILANLMKVSGKLRYTVLFERYVAGKNFKRIAREQRYSYQHVMRAHREGLEELQRIID